MMPVIDGPVNRGWIGIEAGAKIARRRSSKDPLYCAGLAPCSFDFSDSDLSGAGASDFGFAPLGGVFLRPFQSGFTARPLACSGLEGAEAVGGWGVAAEGWVGVPPGWVGALDGCVEAPDDPAGAPDDCAGGAGGAVAVVGGAWRGDCCPVRASRNRRPRLSGDW